MEAKPTIRTAQEIWDESKDAHLQIVFLTIQRKATGLRGDALKCKGNGIPWRAKKLFEASETALAAMTLLGAGNMDEVRQLVVKGAQIQADEHFQKYPPRLTRSALDLSASGDASL